jgi:hypothetical protein
MLMNALRILATTELIVSITHGLPLAILVLVKNTSAGPAMVVWMVLLARVSFAPLVVHFLLLHI